MIDSKSQKSDNYSEIPNMESNIHKGKKMTLNNSEPFFTNSYGELIHILLFFKL